MDSERLLVEQTDGVARVTLNRPERLNALDRELREVLLRQFEELALDRSVRCVLLAGAGSSFCAGGDLSGVPRGSVDPRAGRRFEQDLRRHAGVTEAIYSMPKPVIALIQGHVIGGGLGIALACDLRIGTPTTKLRVGHLTVGLSGDFGISYLLPEIVGAAKAREMAILDTTVGAEDAMALGLLTKVVPDASLGVRGEELARRLESMPALALAKLKENLVFATRNGLRETIQLECANMQIVSNDRDTQGAATSPGVSNGHPETKTWSRRPPHSSAKGQP